MKINCVKCGKKFNAEEHMYICPKCNHYHSQAGARSEITKEDAPVKKYRWETDPIELSDEENFFKRKRKTTEIASWDAPTIESESSEENKKENEYEDVTIGSSFLDLVDDIISPDDAPEQFMTLEGVIPASTKKPKDYKKEFEPSNLVKKIGVIVCIAIGIAIFIGNITEGFESNSESPMIWGEEVSYDTSEYEKINCDEPVIFDAFTVNIEEISEFEMDGVEPKNGYKYIYVKYDTEITGDIEKYDSEVLIVCDGERYPALYEDEMTDDVDLQDDIYEAGLDIFAHNEGNGMWVFEVPEDTSNGEILITSYTILEKNDDWYVELQEDEHFKVPIEL